MKEDTILEITHAEYLFGYCLRLHFNDGTIQVVNFEPFLRHAHHPMIRKYLDMTLFKQFSIVYGDLVWNDYELCFPIADLYAGKLEHAEPSIDEPASISEHFEEREYQHVVHH